MVSSDPVCTEMNMHKQYQKPQEVRETVDGQLFGFRHLYVFTMVISVFALLSSLDDANPEERDIHVKQADMKKHLMVTGVDGRPT